MSQKPSKMDALADLFRPLYSRLFDDDGDTINELRQDLKMARIETPAEVYMSRVMGFGFFVGFTLLTITFITGYVATITGVFQLGPIVGYPLPDNPFIEFITENKEIIIVSIVSPVVGTFGTFASVFPAVFYPKMKKQSRKTEIERLMPDVISYMYALSVGGLNQMEIIEKVAESDETYGEVSQEFRSIMLETEYLDSDYRTAIKNQIDVTPSSQLAQFMSDMLSILDSGGDMQSFLKDKQQKHIRLAKQKQQQGLETLELLGEIYMTVSLFPLLLIIILVIMSMMGDDVTDRLYGIVYGLIPMIGIAFLVLISVVKQDEVGDGELKHPEGAATYSQTTVTKFPVVSKYAKKSRLFARAKRKEQTYQTIKILKRPHIFFREHPHFTVLLTVPAAIAMLFASYQSGAIPTKFDAFKENYIIGTVVYFYIPMYIVFFPLAFFSFWKGRQIGSVTGNLSDTLRKLSSANDAGQPLLASIQTVTQSSEGNLTKELTIVRSKVLYGARMKEALIEFNNKYKIPRLARIVKLITDAQETSEDITEVLSTAASTSENQDDIQRERKSKVRMQLVIIIVTYVILLGVMALLKIQFIEVMGELASQAGGSSNSDVPGGNDASFGVNVDINLLSMLFFHAVVLQAVISGFLGGYMRSNSIKAGIKYVLPLTTLALAVWVVIG